MERKMIIFLLLVSSLLFAVGSGKAPAPTQLSVSGTHDCAAGTMTVNVNANGIALDSVQIKAIESDTGNVVATGTSDFKGVVKFTITKDYKYLVVATKSGYSSGDNFVEVACAKPPVTTQIGVRYHCTDKATVRDRVKCVINLQDEDVKAVNYIPEECNIANESRRDSCVELYRTLQACRGDDMGDADRERCIKPKLNLSAEIRDDVAKCQMLNGSEKSVCFSQLKENAFTMVKFRIYNLIYKAEELKKKGANEDDVIDFIAFIETEKAKFNDAATIQDKIAIVKEVKNKWNAFRENVKSQLGENK